MYSGERVVAAESLSNGQVAVALASGDVNLLKPGDNGLVVASQLKAQSGTAASPSSINVVENSRGGFSVLVSSQGSDTLFVYAQGGSAPPPTLSSSGTSSSTGSLSTGQATLTSAATSLISSMTTAMNASQSSAGASTASSSGATTNSGAAAALSITALSLGGFSSLGNGSSGGVGSAELVGIEGNSYFSVPVLDFGSEIDEAEASRMPGLASEYPIGDTSPLNQFVVGIEEALNDYLGTGDALPSGAPVPSHDPWDADLFGIRPPVESRVPVAETDDRGAAPAPDAAPIDTGRNEQPGAGSGAVPSSPTERVGASLGAPAGFAASLLLVPWLARKARAPRPIRRMRESRR
ncbi:MAG: hypothetical protein U0835_22875 [Isosphaeraceae bacterium]